MTKETGHCLKKLTGFNVLFARRKQLKILSILLTGYGTTLACAGYLYSVFEQDLTSAVDCRGDGIHNFCHIAMWQKSRRDAFNRTKPDCMMIRKIPATIIHSIKRTRSRMRLFTRREAAGALD